MFKGIIKIRNGIIEELIEGSSSLILTINDKKIDFGQSFAYPGFVDSHVHLLPGGESLSMPDIRNCTSAEEVAQRIYLKPFTRGNWIFVRGWDNSNWFDQQLPNKTILDNFFPDIPVCLVRNDGHCMWLNSKALELSQITKDTQNPKGGLIVKDNEENPTGILLDNAMDFVFSILPEYSLSDLIDFLSKAIEYLARNGITEVDDMDVPPQYLPIYETYFSSAPLKKIKINIFLRFGEDSLEILRFQNEKGNENFSLIGIKLYMDGALGSYGALLSEPYIDKENFFGLQFQDKIHLIEIFNGLANNNIALAIHSIGDLATTIILDAYEQFVNENHSLLPLLRIEHSQLVNPKDISHFQKFNVIPSVQPIHFVSDYQMAKKRLGKRNLLTYPWNSFLKNNIKFCSGSDFPIESANPILGIDALVNRDKFDKEYFFGVESISIREAIFSYTQNHHLSLRRNETIFRSGSKANITILDQNLFTIEKDKIRDTKIIATISNGEIIYSI